MPPGGFAKTQAQKESAVDFIIRTVNANPGQITIIAIGPLTNIAIAIRQEPGLAQKIKKIKLWAEQLVRSMAAAETRRPTRSLIFGWIRKPRKW